MYSLRIQEFKLKREKLNKIKRILLKLISDGNSN
jgi:hypothetical protein